MKYNVLNDKYRKESEMTYKNTEEVPVINWKLHIHVNCYERVRIIIRYIFYFVTLQCTRIGRGFFFFFFG